MRTCSQPSRRKKGHRRSRKQGAAISRARLVRGANFLAAKPTAQWPMNMVGSLHFRGCLGMRSAERAMIASCFLVDARCLEKSERRRQDAGGTKGGATLAAALEFTIPRLIENNNY